MSSYEPVLFSSVSDGRPAVGRNSDGRLAVFGLGGLGNGGVVYSSQIAPGSLGWTHERTLPVPKIYQAFPEEGQWAWYPPCVASNEDGRLEVFVIVPTGELLHNWQTAPNTDDWFGWHSLGGPFTVDQTPVCGRNADGRIEVFTISLQGTESSVIRRISQTAPNGGWGAWSTLGGASNPYAKIRSLALGNHALVEHPDGRLEVFAEQWEGQMRRRVIHIWQLVPNGDWSEWAVLSDQGLSGLSPYISQDGRVEVFGVGDDFSVWHTRHDSSGNWTPWSSLGGEVKHRQAITAGRNLDGRLEVFAIGKDGGMWSNWQQGANTDWSGWYSLGTDDTALWFTPTVVSNQDGRLELFVYSGNVIRHRWQIAADNGWN